MTRLEASQNSTFNVGLLNSKHNCFKYMAETCWHVIDNKSLFITQIWTNSVKMCCLCVCVMFVLHLHIYMLIIHSWESLGMLMSS